MVGVSGGKFPAIRNHLQENIGNVYKDMDVSYVTTPISYMLFTNILADSTRTPRVTP